MRCCTAHPKIGPHQDLRDNRDASAYQLAAAFAGWLGGQVINGGLGVRSIYLVGAAVTVAGILVSGYAWYRDRLAEEPTRESAPM